MYYPHVKKLENKSVQKSTKNYMFMEHKHRRTFWAGGNVLCLDGGCICACIEWLLKWRVSDLKVHFVYSQLRKWINIWEKMGVGLLTVKEESYKQNDGKKEQITCTSSKIETASGNQIVLTLRPHATLILFSWSS